MRKVLDNISVAFGLAAVMAIPAMFLNVWLDFTQFTLAPKLGMGQWDPSRASATISLVIAFTLLGLSAVAEHLSDRIST